jgi:hypothetical protein
MRFACVKKDAIYFCMLVENWALGGGYMEALFFRVKEIKELL